MNPAVPATESTPLVVQQKLNHLENTLKSAAPGSLPYYGTLTSTIGNLRSITERTSAAFMADNPIAGAGGILEMASTVMPLLTIVSGLTGPVGVTVMSIISGLFDLAGAVLSSYQPKLKSLSEQIAEELQKFRAQELREALSAAIEAYESALEAYVNMDAASRSWEQIQQTIDSVDGDATNSLRVAKEWMTNNIENSEWPAVFGKYWYAVSLRSQALFVSIGKLRIDTDAFKIGSALQSHQIERDEHFGHFIHRTALESGTVWHVGDNRILYNRFGLVNHKGWSKTSTSGDDLALGPKGSICRLDRQKNQAFLDDRLVLGWGADTKIRGFGAVSFAGKPAHGQNTGFAFVATEVAVPDGHIVLWSALNTSGTSGCVVSGASLWGIKAISPQINHLLLFLLVERERTNKRTVVRHFATAQRGDAPAFPTTLSAAQLQDNGGSGWPLGANEPLGLAVGPTHVYAYSSKQIVRARIGNNPVEWNENWEVLKQVPLESGQTIKNISVGDIDGQLLVVLSNNKIWAMLENIPVDSANAHATDKQTIWVNETNAEAVAVVKIPLDNYNLYRAYLACCR